MNPYFPTVVKQFTMKIDTSTVKTVSNSIRNPELRYNPDFLLNLLNKAVDNFINYHKYELISRSNRIVIDDNECCIKTTFTCKAYDESQSNHIESYYKESSLDTLSKKLAEYYSYCDVIDYKLQPIQINKNFEENKYFLMILYKYKTEQKYEDNDVIWAEKYLEFKTY